MMRLNSSHIWCLLTHWHMIPTNGGWDCTLCGVKHRDEGFYLIDGSHDVATK